MTAAVIGAAFLSTCAAGYVVRRILLSREMLDRPNQRSSHSIATPLGGGYACAVGLVVGVGIAAPQLDGWGVWIALIAGLVLAAVGALDDLVGLPATPRLLAQVGAGAVVAASVGGNLWWGLLGAAVFAIAVNIINFMDGINGITAGTMSLWAVVVGVTATLNDQVALGLLAFAVLGSALGFLPWNVPRARMFLGDVGSYLFGGLAGAGVLMAGHADLKLGWLAVLPFGVYLVDASWTLVRRARRHEHLTEAHREHVYQRLVSDRGWSHVQSTTVAVLVAALMVASALTPLHLIAQLGIITVLAAGYLALPRLVPTKVDV